MMEKKVCNKCGIEKKISEFYNHKMNKDRLMGLELNKTYNIDNREGMKLLDDNSIDLTVTSPPYDDLRKYKGCEWNFEVFKEVVNELYRVTKEGGTVVWIVGDETKNGSESLTSFKQALYFKELGFNVETMIWEKQTFTATGALKYRYGQVFEYMFVLTKGKVKTFNPIKDRENKSSGRVKTGTVRQKDGSTKEISSLGKEINQYGQRFNVWRINTEMSSKNRFHPAQFPEQLASDHILSWSNEGDLVMDIFSGSGTTHKMCKLNNRNFIGFEIAEEYVSIEKERMEG